MPPTNASQDLTDTILRGEIELIADLVVAASDSAGRMSQTQIDEALGLRPGLKQAV